MPVSYTNRKGVTYTLYRGQTKTGKPRYYFARTDQGQSELVEELPPGYMISESVNGVVSLAKDRPSLIQPDEVATVERALKRHPEARRYRIAVKHNLIEVYEQVGPSYDTIISKVFPSRQFEPSVLRQLQADEERSAQYAPVLRFTLLDPIEREFGVERMCYRGSVDGWLELILTSGSTAELADKLIPILGTDEFFELW